MLLVLIGQFCFSYQAEQLMRLRAWHYYKTLSKLQQPTEARKPTPTAIKELEGNPGKRPLNTKEPKPEKKAPSCPKWLEPEAKKEWRRLAKQMEQIGILRMRRKYRPKR